MFNFCTQPLSALNLTNLDCILLVDSAHINLYMSSSSSKFPGKLHFTFYIAQGAARGSNCKIVPSFCTTCSSIYHSVRKLHFKLQIWKVVLTISFKIVPTKPHLT